MNPIRQTNYCGLTAPNRLGVFPHHLRRHFRSQAQGRPTTTGIVDPSKACLVLKHQPDGSGLFGDDWGYAAGEFFGKARCRRRFTSG